MKNPKVNIKYPEFILALTCIYFVLWLLNPYIGFLFSVITIAVCIGVIIIAMISEWIEPSKTPKSIFYYLMIAIAIPAITIIFYLFILRIPIPL